ncbi:MAG: hypothetical protein Q9166_007463 [cf. Caloplaca sp. 2 TL-2023]
MSPPPRIEAEDYLNSHALRGSKKKHPNRRGVASKVSPLAIHGQLLQPPAVQGQDEQPHPHHATGKGKPATAVSEADPGKLPNADQPHQLPSSIMTTVLDDQRQSEVVEGPSPISSVQINESPAVISLRRLSEHGGDRRSSVSKDADKPWQSLRGMLEAMFTASDVGTSNQKQSDGGQTTPQQGISRRNTASREQDRRRLRKTETSAGMLGLEIPAIITLRKATGLFQIGAGPEAAMHIPTEISPDCREGSISSPSTCTLVGIDSRLLGGKDQTTERQDGALTRKVSPGITNGPELLVSRPSKESASEDGRQRSMAETAITVANTFPSPAILASPTGTTSSNTEAERRFSVVHIKSRKSLHQVIWCEDDTSSSSATSSDSLSLTRSESSMIPGISEKSLVKKSAATSKASTRQNSNPTLSKEISLASDALVKAEKSVPVDTTRTPPEGQMLQWSWSLDEDAPYDPMDTSDAAKTSHSILQSQGQPQADASFAATVDIPRLFIPNDDEDPLTRHQPLAVSRRGSFMLDTSSLASMTAEREAGSRRSISIDPLKFSRLGDGGVIDDRNGGQISRRFSRVA